ncbi:serine--tRNA ligase, partial [archaeon]|nr:serine--tRNA ligase [archaeon]
MLDIKLIRENPEIIKKDLEKRDKLDLIKKVDEIRELDILWRENLQKVEKLKHQRNVLSREVAQLKKAGKDATEKLNLVKEIPKKIVDVEEKTDSIQVKIKKIMFQLPNILHDTVPVGADDTQNVSVKKWGKPRKDKTISHVDLLEKWDVGDTARGAKTSGSRFYFLKNELVMLDMALQKFGMDHMMNKGLIPMIPPYMLRREAYDAMTSMDDFEEVIYKIEDEDLYLIATSEHPIGAYHMNETIEKKDLPLKYAGISPC